MIKISELTAIEAVNLVAINLRNSIETGRQVLL